MAAPAKYPVELKERAVALVRERQREGRGRGAIAQVARDLGVHPEVLRHWLGQDDAVRRPAGEFRSPLDTQLRRLREAKGINTQAAG